MTLYIDLSALAPSTADAVAPTSVLPLVKGSTRVLDGEAQGRLTAAARRTVCLARALFDRLGAEVGFSIASRSVPTTLALEMIDARDGDQIASIAGDLSRYTTALALPLTSTSAGEAARRSSLGLFPGRRSVRGFFDIEAHVVADIDPIVHQWDDAEIFRQRGPLADDIKSADRVFCLSHATASDCATYLGLSDARQIRVVPGGASLSPVSIKDAAAYRYHAEKPYLVAVASSAEPEDMAPLFRRLAEDRTLLRRYDILMMAPEPAHAHLRAALGGYGLAGALGDGIVLAAPRTDLALAALLLSARAVIAPTPTGLDPMLLLDALSASRHVVSSLAGAAREIGGGAIGCFDPNLSDDFARALDQTLARAERHPDNPLAADRVRRFTWAEAAETIAADYASWMREPAHV